MPERPHGFDPDDYLPQDDSENTSTIDSAQAYLNQKNRTIFQPHHSLPPIPPATREPEAQRRIDISRRALFIAGASAGLGLVSGLLAKVGLGLLSETHPSMDDKEFKGNDETGPIISYKEFIFLMEKTKDAKGIVHPEKFPLVDTPFTISHVSLNKTIPIITIALGTDFPFSHPTFIAVPYRITDTGDFSQQFPLRAYVEAVKTNNMLYQIGIHKETYPDVAVRGRVTENIDKQTAKSTGQFIFVIEGLSILE